MTTSPWKEHFEKQLPNEKEVENMKKTLSIICAPGLDNFLAWAPRLKGEYEVSIHADGTAPHTVANSDIIWLEWANETAVQLTRMMAQGVHPFDMTEQEARPKVVVRLHSYEAFTNMPGMIDWSVVDHLAYVADHVREIAEEYNPFLANTGCRCTIIPNGVELDSIEHLDPGPGFDIAVVGSINHKKNPAMALQVIQELIEEYDSRFRLHWAGAFQDPRYEVYLSHMVELMELEDHVKFYGHVDDMDSFWRGKNYLLHTSVHEGHSYAIMEAMARGIQPVIHNYYGADRQYREEWLFDSARFAAEKIAFGENCHRRFPSRPWVEEKGWTLDDQVANIRKLLGGLQ